MNTPGPWEVRTEKHRLATFTSIIDGGGCTVVGADSFERYSRTGETETHFGPSIRADDARLIAAAPDLLAALDRLTTASQRRENVMGDLCALISAKDELLRATEQARNAITKAKGTTP